MPDDSKESCSREAIVQELRKAIAANDNARRQVLRQKAIDVGVSADELDYLDDGPMLAEMAKMPLTGIEQINAFVLVFIVLLVLGVVIALVAGEI